MIATSWVPSVIQRGGALAPRVLVSPTIAVVVQLSKNKQVQNGEPGFPSPEIQAAVLAGGNSRRFGSDKCLARLAGDDGTFLDRAVSACREVSELVVIVGDDRPGLADVGYPLIADSVKAAGPLVGLQTALRNCQVAYLLLMACDQPFVTGDLLKRLANLRLEADIIAFAGTGGRPDPLPSLMRTSALLSWVETCLQAGDRALSSMFGGPPTVLTILPTSTEIRALRDIDSVDDLP